MGLFLSQRIRLLLSYRQKIRLSESLPYSTNWIPVFQQYVHPSYYLYWIRYALKASNIPLSRYQCIPRIPDRIASLLQKYEIYSAHCFLNIYERSTDSKISQSNSWDRDLDPTLQLSIKFKYNLFFWHSFGLIQQAFSLIIPRHDPDVSQSWRAPSESSTSTWTTLGIFKMLTEQTEAVPCCLE